MTSTPTAGNTTEVTAPNGRPYSARIVQVAPSISGTVVHAETLHNPTAQVVYTHTEHGRLDEQWFIHGPAFAHANSEVIYRANRSRG